MNVRYSFLRYVIAVPVVAAVLVLAGACSDDLDYRNNVGRQVAFRLTAPDAWHDGMSVSEHASTTRCTSVQPLSGDGSRLYLHTVVADNPVKEAIAVSRGITVENLAAFSTTYSRFSLSGICYTGNYPADETDNTWTAEYAYNLYYNSASGTPAEGGRQLLWPSNGNVRFFAFAPTVEDFTDADTGGSLILSDATHQGSPTLTYTVPSDVTRQVDLMTARADVSAATTPAVELAFGHALTAVRITCGTDMLAGTINEVTIAGINGTGTQVIGSDTWTTSGPATYTITQDIPVSAEGSSIFAKPGATIAGTSSDNLTFMLLPQTLPDGATMTIKFTDSFTGMQRTLSGPIGGHVWRPGKIVTYSISPSSIHISPKLDFHKTPATADGPGDMIPYSGVWYNAFTVKAEITQEGLESKTFDIPTDKVTFKYKLSTGDSWTTCTEKGLVAVDPQPAYVLINAGFDKSSEKGTKTSPFSLSDEYGETANCYMVDHAGYYSLPLVYGNGRLKPVATSVNSFLYYPKHDNGQMPDDGKITGAEDGVLCWQDSPDLIDPDSVRIEGGKLLFRIHKPTLAQGNALLAVRGTDPATGKKIILWSWHIWVTPYKSSFYSDVFSTSTYVDMNNPTADTKLREYKMAKYHLGWCDRHEHNASRTFNLGAVVDMSDYGGSAATPVEIPGTFTQMEFKGSDAGDNTYYQWGRKDPMLGGIYNTATTTYKYKKKGNNLG